MATASNRNSKQLGVGLAGLVLLLVAVGLAFFYVEVAFVFVALGALCLVVAFVLEMRVRRSVEKSDEETFPDHGTFGGRRSPQTHDPM